MLRKFENRCKTILVFHDVPICITIGLVKMQLAVDFRGSMIYFTRKPQPWQILNTQLLGLAGVFFFWWDVGNNIVVVAVSRIYRHFEDYNYLSVKQGSHAGIRLDFVYVGDGHYILYERNMEKKATVRTNLCRFIHTVILI